MNLLITGFEPFNHSKVNPSELIANYLKEKGYTTLILPVSYQRGPQVLKEYLSHHDVDFILSFGLAGNRNQISLEEYAYNEQGASIKDEDGCLITSSPIVDFSFGRYQTTVDLSLLQMSLLLKGIPCQISDDPGRFVCNKVYFTSLSVGYRCLFVHLPTISEKCDLASLEKAADIIVKFIAK